MTGLVRRLAIGAAVLALTVGVCPTAAADPEDVRDVQGVDVPVYLLMDTSDSMSEVSRHGRTRIDAARAAALGVVTELGPDQEFGLFHYPAGDEQFAGCPTAEALLPLSRGASAEAAVRIRGLTPSGNTPTGPALKSLLDTVVYTDGKARALVVLVSDGEENCDGLKACKVAEQFNKIGIDLVINTVGLENSDIGNEQLACVSKAANGEFFTANTENLGEKLIEASKFGVELATGVPTEISATAGSLPGGVATATVTSTGSVPAEDVRVFLDVRTGSGKQAGSVLVPRPRKYLGKLQPNDAVTISFDIRPEAEQIGPATWSMVVTIAGEIAAARSGDLTVTSGTTLTSADAVFRDAKNPVVLGDSYSSGEGTGGYHPKTRTDESRCHRSNFAYGGVLYDNVRNLACSGAVTKDLQESRVVYSYDKSLYYVPAQLEDLASLARSDAPPDLVMLTIGGNDMNFAGIAERCLRPLNNCTTFVDKTNFSALRNTLVATYKQIDRVVNAQDVVKRRKGRAAQIVVLPYVGLLPIDGPVDRCFVFISAKEAQAVNRFAAFLNSTIRHAVEDLRGRGRPFLFVPGVIGAFQPNHTLCEESASYGIYINAERRSGNLTEFGYQELLHPNKRGHEAIARVITRWSPAVMAPIANATAADGDAEYGGLKWELEKWLEGAIVSEVGSRIEAGISSLPTDPASPKALFILNSQPYLLGPADLADGTASGSFLLPRDIPSGWHTLTAVALDAQGREVRVSQSIYVWPEGSNVALIGICLGLLILLTALILRWPDRRRPRAPESADEPKETSS